MVTRCSVPGCNSQATLAQMKAHGWLAIVEAEATGMRNIAAVICPKHVPDTLKTGEQLALALATGFALMGLEEKIND